MTRTPLSILRSRLPLPLLLAGVALFGGSACDALSGASELERSIAAEQRAIAAYAEASPGIDARAAAFAEAWARANEHRDARMYRDDLRAHALPAGQALIAALEAAPLTSEELAAIHAPLVAAHSEVVAALQGLSDALPEVDVAEAYAPVLGALDRLREAEGSYRRSIETYYARNRTTLSIATEAQP